MFWSWVIVLWLQPSRPVPARTGRSSLSSGSTDRTRSWTRLESAVLVLRPTSPRSGSASTEPRRPSRSATWCRAWPATARGDLRAGGPSEGCDLAGDLKGGRHIIDRLHGPDHAEGLPDIGPGDAVMRYPEFPLPDLAQAAAPPPTTTSRTTAPRTTTRRWPVRPQPEQLELGTAATAHPPERPPANPPPPRSDCAESPRCTRRPGGVIRTVVAVIAPFVAAGPNALTQSLTARSDTAADWVSVTDGGTRRRDLEFFVPWEASTSCSWLLLRGSRPQPLAWGVTITPDTETVVPLTPVTLPDTKAKRATSPRKPPRLDPLGNDGRVPPAPAEAASGPGPGPPGPGPAPNPRPNGVPRLSLEGTGAAARRGRGLHGDASRPPGLSWLLRRCAGER